MIDQSIREEIQRRIFLHFASHGASVITPEEWNECVVQIVSDTNAGELKAPGLEADIARLQLNASNEIEAARKEISASIRSMLVDTFNGLAADPEEKDPDAMKRAAEIVGRMI